MSGKAPAEYFTGTVRHDPLFQAPAPARVSGASVTYEPGARTAWHTHPLGQTLIVTAGCGRVQRVGAPIEEIRPGDVIWFPPGEKHWHGAAPTTAMTHVAIRPAPKIIEPTDAVIKMSATCVCGSDLWPYRGINSTTEPTPIGHEYCGIVEDVGRAVTSIEPGQFVIGSFFASDNTCPHCHDGSCSSPSRTGRPRSGPLSISGIPFV